jgi:fructosamine-3-kinase
VEINLSHEQLLELLQQAIGTQVELVNQKIANQQHHYLVLIARLRHPAIQVVIKFAGPGAQMAGTFDRTAFINRLVALNTTIPMPEILAIDMSYQRWPWRYLIRTYIPGQEWAAVRQRMNSTELSGAYQQIGYAVAQLHAIHFPGFGELGIDGSVGGGKSFLAELYNRARSCVTKAQLQSLFFSVLDKNQALFTDIRQASLTHEDLHGYNILFGYHSGRWRLATILDFDKAWAGHHEIDLARLEFWKGMTSDEFWKAYTANYSIESLYEQRRPIYQLLWCFEYARKTPKHLGDTRQLCEELGVRGFVNFD